MRKLLLLVLSVIYIPCNISAQGYYDNNSYMMFELMRAASNYDHTLLEVMTPVLRDIRDKYYNGQYKECIESVNFTFDRVTFYKRNYYIYSWLYYFRGMSYLKTGYEEVGIANLVSSKDAQNEDALKALQENYIKHMDHAEDYLKYGNYSSCLIHINSAKRTTLYNYQLYEIEGKALEGLNRFDEAKKSFKLAKKNGSPYANALLKQLKVHKKEFNKKK